MLFSSVVCIWRISGFYSGLDVCELWFCELVWFFLGLVLRVGFGFLVYACDCLLGVFVL